MNPPHYLGLQYTMELWGCRSTTIATIALVEQGMREAAAAIGATVLSGHFHQFEPHGVSGVLVISESHFSVHTWPEHGYAALDLFTCGDDRLQPHHGLHVLHKLWEYSRSEIASIDRGCLIPLLAKPK